MKEGHALRRQRTVRIHEGGSRAAGVRHVVARHCSGGMEREWLQARRRVCVCSSRCVSMGAGAGLRRSTKGRRWRCPTRQVRRRRQKRAAQTQSKPTALRRPLLAAAAEICSLATTS